jgi:hypothetical protein
MSTQYRLVQSGKTASGGCSASQGSSERSATDYYYYYYLNKRLTYVLYVTAFN